jgi:NAD(P)-dependent dehydrogenase (short-subunit alcohol dehydrogenase family)
MTATRGGTRARRLAADIVDSAAEASIALSFSRVGIALRRRLELWREPPRMDGQVAVVTGATSGIGLAVAMRLAERGAALHLIGRDAGRAERARSAVAAAGGGRVETDLADMASPDEVAALGERLRERYDRLDVLVHNAGSLSRRFARGSSGLERTVATQVIGPYILTAAVAPLLWRGPARIVTVSSGGMYTQPFDLDKLEMSESDYDGVIAYARAKRAQVVLAEAWARHFEEAGVASYSVHPGWVDTPGLRASLPVFRALWRPLLRTPAQGADTTVWLAAGGLALEAGSTGMAPFSSGFFHDRRRRCEYRFPVRRRVRPRDADALLRWCADRTRTETPHPSGSPVQARQSSVEREPGVSPGGG